MVVTWYTAIFLGLVQGLAEFLPISSSGHLLLFEHWLGINEGGLMLTIVLHLATLLAVIIVYWRRLWYLVTHPLARENWLLLVATVITCVLVVLFKDVLDQLFSWTTLPFAFIVTAVCLLLPGILQPRQRQHCWYSAIAMGVAQGIAVVPGLSRSGLTITTGQLTGMSPKDATDFSFLMSIPIIIASLVYELFNEGTVIACSASNLILAFVTAFVAGIVAIKLMLKMTRQIDLRWFAVYLLLLGGGILLFRAWFQMF